MGTACAAVTAGSRVFRALLGVQALLSGKGLAFTLNVTTCEAVFSETADDISFSFCQEGTYCTPTFTVDVSAADGLDIVGFTIGVPVAMSDPTTVVMTNTGIDGWCLREVSWEGGDNLLGDSGEIVLDDQFGSEFACFEGLNNPNSPQPCQSSWRFFNLNDAEDYTYDVTVTACDGTKSSTVKASFCSTSWCFAGYGEMVNVTLTMGDVDGGRTVHEVELPFNPLAMKLVEVDSDWCADEVTYNGYTIIGSSTSVTDFDAVDNDGARTKTVSNIQFHGVAPTPSPSKSHTPAPTPSRESPASTLSLIAAGVVGFALLAVAVATFVGLKRHLAAQNKRIGQSCQALGAQGSFWSAMVALAALFITLNIFNFASMWGIVSICAAVVLWFVSIAWFVVFKTGTPTAAPIRASPFPRSRRDVHSSSLNLET